MTDHSIIITTVELSHDVMDSTSQHVVLSGEPTGGEAGRKRTTSTNLDVTPPSVCSGEWGSRVTVQPEPKPPVTVAQQAEV